MIRGEIVDILIHDVGGELDTARVTTLMGLRPAKASLVTRSPAPPYATTPAPVQVRATTPAAGDVTVRLHSVGAMAIRRRRGFEVADLKELVTLLRAPPSDAGAAFDKTLLADLEREIQPAVVEPYDAHVAPEPYTAVCVTSGLAPEHLLEGETESVAAIIQGETETGRLARTTIESSIRHTIRYYRDDALVLGWDNALLVAPEGTYEDVLDVIELANLELLELRAFDAYLDQRLDEAFEALDRLWAPGGLFRSARAALADISGLRVDFARLTDTLRDTGKLFGDWYLAKVHRSLRDRFHLPEWERAVQEKMGTLEDMFHLAEEEATHRRSLVLETMIVLLFILDLALIFVLAQH